MQIAGGAGVSGAGLQPMRGAEIALKLMQAAQNSQQSTRVGTPVSASDDVNSLLRYVKDASASKAVAAPAEPYNPAADLPSNYEVGALVDVDTLDPAYRDFARSLGATHVRLYGRAEVDDAAFQAEISAALDEWFRDDAGYRAARAEGKVTFQRQSDVMAALGETRSGTVEMALYRGVGGSEYIGSGGIGHPSEKFTQWWSAQNAAGVHVSPGSLNGLEFVATWPSARTPERSPTLSP